MGCYESLVKSNFLSNAANELQLARKILKVSGQLYFPPFFSTEKKVRKQLYDRVAYHYYLKEEIVSSLEEMMENKRLIYYVNTDNIFFTFSMDKSQIEGAIQFAFNIDGHLPLYTTKHRFKNKTVYTAMFDNRIVFNPFSPN